VASKPIAAGDAQARLEDVLYSAVTPRLNLGAATIVADKGGYFIVVRVHQRSGPLHMVDAYEQRRYFIRTGLSTRPMEAHEIERAFADLQYRDVRIDALITRLPLVARIAPDRSRAPEEHGNVREPAGTPWSSVVTAPLDGAETLLTMRTPAQIDFPIDRERPFVGEPSYILTGIYTIDGHGYISDHEHKEWGRLVQRTRLFREGVFEWGIRYRGTGKIFSRTLVQNVHDALVYFGSIYEASGYFGRVRAWVRVDNADRSDFQVQDELVYSAAFDAPRAPTLEGLGFSEDTSVEQLLRDPTPLVHAAMDRLWQGYGFPRCLLYSPDGRFLTEAEMRDSFG
jgi:hypothetical protein